MNDTDKARSGRETGRAARLKAALRENLRRRKAQLRGREDMERAETIPAPPAFPERSDR